MPFGLIFKHSTGQAEGRPKIIIRLRGISVIAARPWHLRGLASGTPRNILSILSKFLKEKEFLTGSTGFTGFIFPARMLPV